MTLSAVMLLRELKTLVILLSSSGNPSSWSYVQISVSSSPAVFVKDTVSPLIWNESAVTSSFEKSTTFSASAPESELLLSASAVLFFFVSTTSTARSSTKRIRQAAIFPFFFITVFSSSSRSSRQSQQVPAEFPQW